MSYKINPDVFENGSVSIDENADGDLEITHPTSGESITVGPDGFGANSVDTDDATIERVGETVIYASENIPSLPSIQTALDMLTNGGGRSVCIVGGKNEVSSSLVYDGSGELIGSQRGVYCDSGSYITQANGADLDYIFDLLGSGNTCHLDLNIVGNQTNNTTNVTGVRVRNASNCRIYIKEEDCWRGTEVTSNTEATFVYHNSRNSVFGLEETEGTSSDPDENYYIINSKGTDTTYKKSAGKYTTAVVNAEGTNNGGQSAVQIDSGIVGISGVLRGAGEDGIQINQTNAVAHITNMIVSSPSRNCVRVTDSGCRSVQIANSYLNDAGSETVRVRGGTFKSINNTIRYGTAGYRLDAGSGHVLGPTTFINIGTAEVNAAVEYEEIDTTTIVP